MSELDSRYDRNIRLFGEEGQKEIRATTVSIVGVGGLGSALAQHLALLGVKQADLIDREDLDETNRNRFVGARHGDPVPGSAKVELVARLIREINPHVNAVPHKTGLVSDAAFAAVRSSDWVFGCFDDDGPRAILNEICAAYDKPYIDLASDVPEPGVYGGRVCVSWKGQGCLNCLDLLDRRDVRRFFANERDLIQEDAVYGIGRDALGEKGPAVSPLNGVIAALAATEFMVAVTGMRAPSRLIEYRGHLSKVLVNKDRPHPNCVICDGVWGKGEDAQVERYLTIPKLRSAGTS